MGLNASVFKLIRNAKAVLILSFQQEIEKKTQTIISRHATCH